MNQPAVLPNTNEPGIDAIPTLPSARKALIVSIATIMLGGLAIAFWQIGPQAFSSFLETNALVEIHLKANPSEALNYHGLLSAWFNFFGIVGAVCVVTGLISLLRSAVTYHVLRVGLVLVYPAVIGYVVLAWMSLGSLRDVGLAINGVAQDRVTMTLLWWDLVWPALAAGLYAFWLHVMLWSRSVYAAFTSKTGPTMRGDEVLEDWRTHGKDPRARRSLYGSFATHVLIIFIIPFLLQSRGCVEPYRVPQGSGEPAIAQVKVIKKKKEKKKKLALRPNSAIIFDIPDLDELEVDKVMEQLTQATYEANSNKAGKLGKGGGPKGGWPEGMENYKIRFIRLDHGGDGWDDGMDQTDADINFLNAFAQATGFNKIAAKGESHSISLLAKYPYDGFPPFVYLTGNGGMGTTNANDWKVLREYCLGGGMLIADAGSAGFDRSIRQFISKVFPDKPLIDIADDDILYQLPFGFPDGAPAFWAHGGRRAIGIKHDGRWIAFYHPGDMNDAWKSPGYSDVTPEMRTAATNLGINLVYYAFNQWDDAVSHKRK